MPFNCLLMHCLRLGNSVTEQGITAVFQPKHGEVALIFQTDKDEFKNRYAKQKPVSDFIFFCKKISEPPSKAVIVFVELGGNKGSKSADQLRETVTTVKNKLTGQSLGDSAHRYAVVAYSAGSAPKDHAQVIKEFRDKLGTSLKFKHAPTRIDIREVLGV